MALLSAFNPHELKADTVLRVATGREGPLARLLHIIRGNLTAPTKQHVIVSAPRGYGKSFLLRYVQVKIEEIAKREGLPIAMALLSEELPHVKEPDTLLAEIRRTFLNEPAETVGVRWVEDDGEAWYQRVAELDAAIVERLGSNGLLIAGVENFDLLVRKAFAKDVHGGSLREFLTRKGNRVMLLTASARGAFDRAYDRPLFKAFEEIPLEPWSVEDCIAFFHAQRAAAGRQPLTDLQEAKAKAVATFIGGTPRLATLIGESLLEDDLLRAADLLDKLVDELTPYYKERIEVLPTRSQALLDGLLRGGERCSATELARRVGAPNQPAIAAPLDELKKDLVVIGEKAPDSAEVLLRVADRVFAHYYRKRILSHGQEICPLEALVELLAVFYSPEEKRREAEKLKARGLVREAAVMERLWQAEQARVGVTLRPRREGKRVARFDERISEWDSATDKGRFEDGLLILDKALAIARAAGDTNAEAEAFHHRGWTLARLLRYDEALAAARETSALAERAGNVLGKATGLRAAASCLNALGRYSEALNTAHEAAALAERVGAVSQQTYALRIASDSLDDLGRHEEAVATAREAVALAEGAGDVSEQAVGLSVAAFSLGKLGLHEEAVTTARKAATLAQRAGDVSEQAEALRNAAWNLGRLGRHEEGIVLAREAVVLAERSGDECEQAIALSQVADCLGDLERDEEAVATARKAAVLAERAGDEGGKAYALYLAAFSLCDLGRHEEALAAARESALLAERVGNVTGQASALSQVAESLNDLGRHEEAIASAREAAVLAERAGDIDARRSVSCLFLSFRTLIGLDDAITSYKLLVDTNDDEGAALWFDDVAHVVTVTTAWPRLAVALERSPRTAERIVKSAAELGEAGNVIAAAHAANQRDMALSQARHLVAALAHAIETATNPALARLWVAVLNASAERIATNVEDATFLREFADILTAHAAVPERAKSLIAAATAYHDGGRDPTALARLEPDLATTLAAVFPPKAEPVNKERKPRVRRKR
jgi:tetratricopeptide (TPR) repeat protein